MTPEETLDMIEEYVLGVLNDEANGTLPEWFSAATVASRVNYMITSASGRNDTETGGQYDV